MPMKTSGHMTNLHIASMWILILGASPIYAACPNNNYLNGTFVLAGSNLADPNSKLNIAKFDGAGNATFSETINTNGTITEKTGSTTYCVAADGSFTLGGTEPDTGYISNDGNTIETVDLTAGSGAEFSVGVKYGFISNGNSASGPLALASVTTGINNTAIGYDALNAGTTGNYNVALGYQALNHSQSGLGNIGVGPLAGQNIAQGQLNIDIGSWGTADESNTIRIGIPAYHLHTYIAGIATTQVTGAQVVVTADGQLGVLASSERYKADINPLVSATERLSQLRPVSFHLKTDPSGAIQYGLIAEEVDKVYPELVIRDNEGKIQGVRYDELAPMLLKEVQVQASRVSEDHSSVAMLVAQHEADVARIASLEQQLAGIQAALANLLPKDELVAQR